MAALLSLFNICGSPNKLSVLLSATALKERLPPSRVNSGPLLLLEELTRIIGLKCLTPIEIGPLSPGLAFNTCLFIPRLAPAVSAALISGRKPLQNILTKLAYPPLFLVILLNLPLISVAKPQLTTPGKHRTRKLPII